MRRAELQGFRLARGPAILLTIAMLAYVSAAQTSATAPCAAPSNWPIAQFVSSKDESVVKACKTLSEMIRALGGDAYLNVQSLQSEGRTYSFYHGQPNGTGVLFWSFWQWPDKYRVELTKQRDIVELFTGDKGYEITYKGTAEQDAKEMQDYIRRRNHSLEWVVRKWLPDQGTMIIYSGTAMVERNLADQVTVLGSDNDSVTLSIDAQTRLPVRVAYSWRDPQDRQMDDESVVFSNFKLVQGVQTAYSTVRNLNGEMANQRFITSASYNTNMPATLFETKGITYNQKKQDAGK